ncbi:MAG: alpha-L-arabinofuranosidase C-terminal domain-containing protein [Rikenellaceae bacterium]|nr:alpha-L-arabinofuranosidase C-terminal domain-containing protein [Rikenellaceae bacterium]
MKHLTTLLLALASLCAAQATEPARLTIDAAADGHPIAKTMYGLFFEDINFAADGGLYAELVKNRSFDFDHPTTGWRLFGNVELREDGPFERNPHYVRLRYSGHRDIYSGVENEGFFGIALKEGAEYRFSVWARTLGEEPQQISINIVGDDPSVENTVAKSLPLRITSPKWQQYEVTFTAPATIRDGRLRLILEQPDPKRYSTSTAVDLEHISLFPTDTYRGVKNGLRKDLAEALEALRPGIFRFPGGCIIEGTTLETRYQWKNSVGPVENRPANQNRWHYTFRHRLFPDYYQSYGLGFYEFFCFSEQIGAEPLPVVSCGLACQFQNDSTAHCSMEELQTYIDDALDLIEFANGDPSTPWGKVRAEMGHPEPFNLKYLGIGNEQWGEEFIVRFEPFVQAVRAKYPEIQIVGTSGPSAGGERFDYLWKEMRRLEVDLVDEHYYANEAFFTNNADRYDNYPRTGPKVFAGEYACHGANGKKFNHFNASLLEAAFMTGLERNADVVRMATFAPLLAHVEGWQWRPDLVWFDNLRMMRSSSYYVQQLYATNRGTASLPITLDGAPAAGKELQRGLYASAVIDEEQRCYIVKVANLAEEAQPIEIVLEGLKRNTKLAAVAERTILVTDDPMAENTLDNPTRIAPYTELVPMTGRALNTVQAARSFAVYKIAIQ